MAKKNNPIEKPKKPHRSKQNATQKMDNDASASSLKKTKLSEKTKSSLMTFLQKNDADKNE